MTSSANPVEPVELLRRARARVEADAADASARTVTAPTAFRALPADVETVLAARKQERLDPLGYDYPREPVRKIAGVAAAVGAVGIVIFVLGLVTGDAGLISIGAAEIVVFGGGAGAIYRYAQLDPLRLSARQRRTIEDARRWTPPHAADPLLAVATVAAQRIVDSPSWRSGTLAQAGVLVPLAAELDTLAATPSLDRVAALVAYADIVEALRGGTAELDAVRVETLAYLTADAIRDAS